MFEQVVTNYNSLAAIYNITALLSVTLIYAYYGDRIKKQIQKSIPKKITKHIKFGGYKTLSLLWVVCFAHAIFVLTDNNYHSNYRIFTFVSAIAAFVLLNFGKALLFTLFFNFVFQAVSLVRSFCPKRNIETEVKGYMQVSKRHLVLFGVLASSFLLKDIISKNNYLFLLWGINLTAALYLLGSLINVFILQRHLLSMANFFDRFDSLIEKFENDATVKKKVIPIAKMVISFIIRKKNVRIKYIELLDKFIEKLSSTPEYARKFITYFRLIMTAKLAMTILFATLFLMITQANIHQAMKTIGVSNDSITYYVDYLLGFFHLFQGEPLSAVTYNNGYLGYNKLFILMYGWSLPIIFVAFFLEILTISIDEFTGSVKAVSKKVVSKLRGLSNQMKEIEPTSGDLKNVLSDGLQTFVTKGILAEEDINKIKQNPEFEEVSQKIQKIFKKETKQEEPHATDQLH